MFLLMSVILSTGGRGSASVHAGIPHPPRSTPPPQKAHTPSVKYTPPGKHTPLEADSSIRSMSGRYASYWNAFLLPPANKVWGKVIFLHPFVILFTGGWHAWLILGGMCDCSGGACMVAPGGCLGACVVAPGGHAWLLPGGVCMVAPGGRAWLLPVGGCVWLLRGGMHVI